jgi:hypothetical protein
MPGGDFGSKPRVISTEGKEGNEEKNSDRIYRINRKILNPERPAATLNLFTHFGSKHFWVKTPPSGSLSFESQISKLRNGNLAPETRHLKPSFDPS